MNEHAINQKAHEVQAILDGRRTQLRQVMKPQPPEWCTQFGYTAFTPAGHISGRGDYGEGEPAEKFFKCPYGAPGDLLWVRETFAYATDFGYDTDYVFYRASYANGGIYDDVKRWKPSIHMPRWASRIQLRITDMRVERVQEITEEDAKAEGIRAVTKDGELFKYCVYDMGDHSSIPWADMPRDAITAFFTLWNTINAARGFGWDSNPWVWVVSFERVEQEESK
jgi:hypothetical protein